MRGTDVNPEACVGGSGAGQLAAPLIARLPPVEIVPAPFQVIAAEVPEIRRKTTPIAVRSTNVPIKAGIKPANARWGADHRKTLWDPYNQVKAPNSPAPSCPRRSN